MDLLGRATRAGAFRETEILTARTGNAKDDISWLGRVFRVRPENVPKTVKREIFVRLEILD